ncbi:MAG TPA: hypothetical protein VK196_11755 [Magnetospirillum sp.]|nr:hypothetical protein [Magnetospirillum sp.]
MDHWSISLAWWITAVELPALGGLFLMIWRGRSEVDDRMDELDRKVEVAGSQLREALAAYKLEVAKTYATTGTLKDVERRLTEHLVRIEAKLDAVSGAGARA